MTNSINDEVVNISTVSQDEVKEGIEEGLGLEEISKNVLRKHLRKLCSSEDQPSTQQKEMNRMGLYMLSVVRRGRVDLFNIFIECGFPINFQSDNTGATSLHIAAAFGARHVIRVLVATKETDYLLRDKQGRLASELAFIQASDPAVARLLRYKEVKQADKLGIKLTRRPTQK